MSVLHTILHWLGRSIHWVRQAVVPVIIVLFTVTLGTFFYIRAETIMAQQLRERLQSTATVAASQFDPAVIARVRTAADAGSPDHRALVSKLQWIRAMTPGARFAYVVRATDNPLVVRFVADADEFLPPEQLDRDRDGVVTHDEIPAGPGDEYDIASMVEFQHGFLTPSVDNVVTYDRWGAFVSGYAPIQDSTGRTVAVLGIDMNADEFLSITRSVFSPVALVLVLTGGVMLGWFSLSVVQRRKLESLRQLEIERTALLDLGTHQLGMPLATFRWWLELLSDRNPESQTAEEKEAYEQLQLGVDRMDHIIRSLQDAARLQSGVTYHAEPTDASSFAREVIASMESAFHLKKQRVELVVDGVPQHALIDRKLVSGVLAELLENARGYSPTGSQITVRVSAEKAVVKIEVIDRGCGIPKKELPRIFHKFTRGRNAYAYKPVGNGLGLYICKGIVERGGGRLTLKSEEGKGTVVTLELPVAK